MPARMATFDDLLGFLSEEQASFRHDAAAQIVELGARSGAFEGPVFLRWERHVPYLQIVAPMVHDVADDRVAEIEDAICRANHAVALPGFGYDFVKRFVYFRVTVPLERDGVAAELMKRTILAAVNNARDFLPAFRAVAAGTAGARALQLVAVGDEGAQFGPFMGEP